MPYSATAKRKKKPKRNQKRNEWNNTQHNRNSFYYLFNISFDNCNINSNIR